MRLLLLLLLVAVVEVAVLIAVGDLIGLLPTLLVLLAASVLGLWLLRREGTRAFAALTDAVRSRRPPRRELSDGMLIAAGGVLILLPGLVSDVLGLLVLLPPTRALLRRRIARAARRRVGVAYGSAFRGGPVVEGEVVTEPRTPEGPAPAAGAPGQPLSAARPGRGSGVKGSRSPSRSDSPHP